MGGVLKLHLSKNDLKYFSVSTCLTLTTIVLILVVLFLSMILGTEEIEKYCNILGSVGTGLALMWIIAGHYQQRNELKLQREELALQRFANQQQVEELKHANRISLIQELARMLQDGSRDLKSGSGALNDINELPTAIMPTDDWKVARESTKPMEVMAAANNYIVKFGKVSMFLHVFAEAARQYFLALKVPYVDNNNPAIFIDSNSEKLMNVYPFRAYLGSVAIASKILVSLERDVKALTFATMTAAMAANSTNIVKTEKMLDDYLELKAYGMIPAVSEQFTKLFEDLAAKKAS